MATNGDLEVRRARSDDLDAVAKVWFESACSMDGGSAEMPTVESLRTRMFLELDAGWELHVAVRREKVVGMLALKPESAILDQLFVHPSDQCLGVGQTLLNVAKRVMLRGFMLRTAPSNLRGRAFYEREGLSMREGLHPRTGAPACYYSWNAGERVGQDIELPGVKP